MTLKKEDMNTKYKLLEKERNGLHRIIALRDFGDVEKGDIGGYVESELNLSQQGTCWIYDDAVVFGDMEVRDSTKIFGRGPKIYGYAKIL